ncbi:uncharacterized protein [Narcine bancroftii]|uniref:uncharacterized protein n=1 Tax=Narcine bancroftii TaxID=1343680 RepID=UPI0038317E44
MSILPWRFVNMGNSGQVCSKVTGDCCQHMGQMILANLGTVVVLQILINTLYMVLPSLRQLIASCFHFWTRPQMSKKLIISSEDMSQGKNLEILDWEKCDGKPPSLDAEVVNGPRCVPAGEPAPWTPAHVCCCPHLRPAAGPVTWDLRGEEASPPFCLSVHSCSLTPNSQPCFEGAPSSKDSGSGPQQAQSDVHSHEAWSYAKDQRPGQAVESTRPGWAKLPGQVAEHAKPSWTQLPGQGAEHARPRQAQSSREVSTASPNLHHHRHKHRFYRRACPVTSPAPTTSSSSSSCSVAYSPWEVNEQQSTGRVVYDAKIVRSRLGRGDAGAGFRAPNPYIYADVD